MSAVDSFASQRLTFSRVTFSVFAVAAEAIAILAASVLTGLFTRMSPTELLGKLPTIWGWHFAGGGFALPFLLREDYRVEAIVEGRRQLRRLSLY